MIFLQNGFCAIAQALSSYEVWKDFIVPIGITFLAGAFAYLIFVIETRRDKKKDRKVEKQLQRDKLSYFSNVVKNIISVSEQQNDNILAFVKEQRADPSEVKQILLYSLNELRRITTDLKLESYMLAYVNYYDVNRQVAIKEFNNIIIRIDMLYESLKVVDSHHQMAQEAERNYKVNLRDYHLRVSGLVAKLSLELESASELTEEIQRITAVFFASQAEDNWVEFCYQTFFVPFNNFAVKNLNEPQFQELAILTRDGKAVYEQLIKENQGLADEFERLYKYLKPEIQHLKENAKRLLEDFGA